MGFFQQAEIGNDWLVLAICIGLLLPLVSIGPDYRSYRILLRKMLTFKVPGNELSLAAYSLPGSIIAVLSFSVSMASVVLHTQAKHAPIPQAMRSSNDKYPSLLGYWRSSADSIGSGPHE